MDHLHFQGIALVSPDPLVPPLHVWPTPIFLSMVLDHGQTHWGQGKVVVAECTRLIGGPSGPDTHFYPLDASHCVPASYSFAKRIEESFLSKLGKRGRISP